MVSTWDHAEAQRAAFLAEREAVAGEVADTITATVLPPRVTVECDYHGPMTRDQPRFRWFCEQCGRDLPDTEVYRLSRHGKDGDTVPIVVT
jgi:hypothetical protein